MTATQKLTSHTNSGEATDVDSSGAKRQTIEQTMERLPRGTRRLAAQLRSPIDSKVIWSVLTDYERLSAFIPNLASSKIISRSENKVELKQVGTQQFIGMRFSAQVQLELIEKYESGDLEFRQIKGDFRRFEGAWRMRSLGEEGTCLLYELTVQGCLGMPVGLIEQRLREDLTTNLLAVEREASKKAKKK